MRLESLNSFKFDSSFSGKPEVIAFEKEGNQVIEGIIKFSDTDWIPILEGVPSFLQGVLQPDLSAFAKKHGLKIKKRAVRKAAKEQAKTNETFSDKWRRFKNYGLSDEHQEFLLGWYCKKFGLTDRDALVNFYKGKKKILECGPGSGFNSKFMAENCSGEVFACDISDAAFTTFGNTKQLNNVTVVQADLMTSPFNDNTFDFVIADGVLHHTPNTHEAVKALYAKVAPGGQFFFYIYKKMGAARYFVDQHIRNAFMPLDPEACYEACEGLTELGRELSRLNAKITLDKPIPVLGIPAGTHDVQRLMYYNFVKCFWNEAFDYETNNMVNFDWYHPHNAWQHNEEEVNTWLTDLGAKEWVINDANPNGLSVLVTKPKG